MYRHEIILDNENENYALYCENKKMLSINLRGNKRTFTMKQIETETVPRIQFIVDDKILGYKEFEERLIEEHYSENEQLTENFDRIKKHF